MNQSRGEKIFGILNMAALGLVALLCLYPFLYTLTISLSTASEASREGLHLFPREISFASYRMVLSNPNILTGYGNTILRTVLGTTLSLLGVCIAAYPLSRREMPRRSMITFMIVFTMLFNGGLVPTYLLIRNLGLINNIFSLIFPSMLAAFNIIIVKNFFQSLPESLVESARIDGAGDWRILFTIFIPLSKPALATVALWTSVFHWNSWFDAMLYITDDRKQVLQTFLQRIVIESNTQLMEVGIHDTSVVDFTSETVKAATIIITILPIICVYPFLQKYFVKGIMLGGVKE